MNAININVTVLFCLMVVFVSSCTTNNKNDKITNSNEYDSYLSVEANQPINTTIEDYEFWKTKYQSSPNQFPYLIKMADAQSKLFELTGNIYHLTKAGNYLDIVNQKTSYNNAAYLRLQAKNSITQHQFKQALELLEKAEKNGENLLATQKMLFDANLELGNFDDAENYLLKINNGNDFDYLIRKARWEDHNGNLEKAIQYMEKATEKAEYYDNENLMQWSYTNLADFYGHDGRIQDSYQFYLKALAINPNNNYSKKGIAWIAYSYEKDVESALKILNNISEKDKTPDYHLFKAEIAEYQNDNALKAKHLENYYSTITQELYGDMYNKYKVTLLAEEFNNTDKALLIAQQEVKNRPTPQTFGLLAWVYYHQGNHKEALSIVEQHVKDQTFEPEVQYQMAEIYKANQLNDKAAVIKKELLEASFELGPVMHQKIHQL